MDFLTGVQLNKKIAGEIGKSRVMKKKVIVKYVNYWLDLYDLDYIEKLEEFSVRESVFDEEVDEGYLRKWRKEVKKKFEFEGVSVEYVGEPEVVTFFRNMMKSVGMDIVYVKREKRFDSVRI